MPDPDAIALLVFAGLLVLLICAWFGWLPRGLKDLLGPEDDETKTPGE